MKKVIFTENAPAPVGPYSQAIEAQGFIFCSGQIPIDPQTNELVLGSIEDQTRLVMKNIGAVLEAAGTDFNGVIKTGIFIKDMKHFSQVNSVYETFFSQTPPARSCVAVRELPKGVDVEIEVIAQKK